MMQFDFAALSARDRYKLLGGLVVPRPIALVTTRSSDGRDNAAPFSFFNVFAEDPPIVVLGLGVAAGAPLDQIFQASRRVTGLGPHPDNTLRADAGGRNAKVVTTSVGGDGLRHLCSVYGVHPRRAEGS